MRGKNIYLILGAILIIFLFMAFHAPKVSADIPTNGYCSTITTCSDGSGVNIVPSASGCGSGYEAVCGDAGYDWCCPDSTTATTSSPCPDGTYPNYTCSGTYNITTLSGGTCVGTAPYGYSCNDFNTEQDCINSGSAGIGYDCVWQPSSVTTTYDCSGLDSSNCSSTSGCTSNIDCISNPTCSDTDGGLNYTVYGAVTNGTSTNSNTYQDSCNGNILTEQYCSGTIDASTTYDCTSIGDICSNGVCVNTAKLADCSVCNSNSDCNSGICASQLGSQDKVCISSGCAITPPTGSQVCQESDGTTECSTSSDSTVTCNGTTHTWETNTTCASGESCDATSTPKECTTQNPVLLWLQLNGMPLSPANTLSGKPGDPSTAAQLFVQDAQGQTGTFYLNESGLTANHSIKTIINPVYNSGVSNSLSYNWSITNDSLTPVGNDHLTNPNQYNFYFTYNGYKSPILNYTNNEGEIVCGNNLCQPPTENYTTCPGDCPAPIVCGNNLCQPPSENYTTCPTDCPAQVVCGDGTCSSPSENYTNCPGDCPAPQKVLQWRNGTSPYNLVSAIIINDSDLFSNPLNLQAYLSNPSSSGVTAIYNDYPKNGGVSEFNSNLAGQQDSSGSLAYPLTIGSSTVESWRSTANGKSIIGTNKDGTKNELYYIEASVDGQKTNFSIEIDNVLACKLDGTNCNADCSEVASCNDYNNSLTCNSNPCTTVGTMGNPSSYCSWDNSKNVCNRVDSVLNSGTCTYTEETTTGTCNTTGQLTYSWTANWTWAQNSEALSFQALNPDGTLKSDYVKLPNENNYRYDPNRIYESCQNGRKVLLCPAKVQLSFFNFKNILAAIILIVLIYFVLSFGRGKKRVEKKTTKAVKKVSKPKKKVNKKISKKK